MGAVGFVGFVGVGGVAGCCRVWWVLHGVVGVAGIIHRNKKKFSTCTVENPHIINSIYLRSIIKENDFNGKDQDRIYSNNYHS